MSGVELTILNCDEKGNLSYEEMENAVRENTKAIVCTHASNLTGNMINLKRVGQIASKKHILFVVDASQTAGVYPIDVQELGVDVLCFTGHKGLLGPQGTGGLYVREGVEIRPLLCGGSGVDTYNMHHPSQMPTALEAGTLNGLATRPGAHCAPLMHKALGTVEQGAVRFSFSHYNTEEEVDFAIRAIKEL